MAKAGSVGIVETKFFTFAEPPHEMILDSGAKLGPITLAYETYGALNAGASNAILVTHGLSGDAHAAGQHDAGEDKIGWWDAMIGPGKPFNTDEFFIVSSNVIGGCMGSTGPTSENPATGKPYGLDFPVVTIGDMVAAQRELLRHLGIERLLCVAGGSMGGMQALEWAVRFPDYLQSAIVIAANHKHSAQQIAFHTVGRHAIQADPSFRSGEYHEGEAPAHGLALARMLGHITYLSDEAMQTRFGRDLQDSPSLNFQIEDEFAIESYLNYQGSQFVNRFDANTYLYVSKALDYFDLSSSYGSLDEAMARIQAKVLVLSFSSDWLYPPYQSEEVVYALARQHKNVSYCKIYSDYGHDAFLLENKAMEKSVEGFLKCVMHPDRPCEHCEQNTDKLRTDPPTSAADSIYRGRRVDYDRIVDLVEPESRVLDIGCGMGELLCMLDRKKKVRGMGLELAQDSVVSAISCGIPVVQADIDQGLGALPDHSFDYVLLSMTLQVIERPEPALREMLRVGRKCIVSFPNFGLWRVRLKAGLLGRAPVTRNLPYAWHQSPNRHVLSIKDFRAFCRELGLVIEQEIPLTSEGAIRLCPNLLAEEALYVLSKQDL